MIRALVVDNNPVLLRAVSAFLEQNRCVVDTAINGLEALGALKSGTYDILFTDLVMPLVSGEQLCKIVRNTPSLKEIYIVVVSGIVLEDLENILSAEYYDQCIAKGTLHDLKQHIGEALDEFRGGAGGGELEERSNAKIPAGLEKSSIAVELLSETKHLSTILDSLDEGIVELDHTGTVVSANRAASEILEVREEDIIGKQYQTFNWSDDGKEVREWVYRHIVNGGPDEQDITGEVPIRLRDKYITLSLIRIAKGEGFFSVCIIRDITRRFIAERHERELNSAMELIRKMESLSSMAGGVAHDFNNLLTVICGNLDMLLQQQDMLTRSGDRCMLRDAKDAAYKAVALSTKISHSSPYGIVSHLPVELDNIVSETIHYFSSSTGAICNLVESGMDIVVRADRQQIETALKNVLENSLEASPKEVIDVQVKIETFDEATVVEGQYIPQGSYAAAIVTDNGPGINREDLLKIFDPYFSTKQRGAEKGMGLGLTVVYSTMRNHGGYVVVDSGKGGGTRVRLLLPLVESRKKEVHPVVQVQCETMNVLLVEQDLQAREVCRTILEFLGCKVEVRDEIDSLGVFLEDSNSCFDGEQIDMLLFNPAQSAVAGPEEIVRTAKGYMGDDKIVVIGLSSLDSRIDYYREFGLTRFLTKPYTFDGIKSAIGQRG